jgi:hypothetical protein
MHKKLITACMAIAAFAAFVMAPAASASPVLTDETPGGIVDTLQPGAWITGTTTGEAVFTGPFNVRCHGHLSGTVTQNNGTQIKGTVPVGNAIFTGTGTGGDCTSALGNVKVTVTSELCMETVKATDNVFVNGCSGAPITFDLAITNVITCKYSTASVTGTFKTSDDATVNLSEQPAKEEEPKSAFCPDEGSLDMDFDLTTTDGTTIKVS